MRWRPFSIHYKVEGGELIVHMSGRDEKGKRVHVQVLGTKPSFFVPAGEGKVNETVLEVQPAAARSLAGPWGPSELVDRCFVKYPFDVPRVRDQYSNSWESDVVYERRVRYDLGIRECIETPDGKAFIWADDVKPSPGPTIEPRIVCYDIETADSLDTEETPESVVALALWDSKTDTYTALYAGPLTSKEQVDQWMMEKGLKGKVHILPSERALFQAFTDYLAAVSPDVLTNWNYISFDQEYMKNRADKMGYPAPNWKEYEAFDCMEAYGFLVKQRSGTYISLDEAAQEAGIEGKTTKKRIKAMQAAGEHAELVIYNTNDVKMVVELMKKHKLVSFFARLSALAGSGLGDAFNGNEISLGRLAESFTMHRTTGTWVLPRKDKDRVAKYWYKVDGAIALPPVAGLHKSVFEIDNSTEYVATVRGLNISPDTLVRDDYDGPCFQLPSGRRYRKEPRGLLPTLLDELAKLREDTKKAIADGAPGAADQDAVAKSLSNTTAYGTISSKEYRIGDPDVGNDITDVPRRHLQWNADFVAREGHQVIGGFTDGVFYIPTNGSGHDPKEMLLRLNATLGDFARQFGADHHYFAVKLEHPYVSGVLRAHDGNTRGSYAMVYEDDGKGPAKEVFERDGKKYRMKIRGFEERRGDTAPITKELQREVLFRAAMGEDVVAYLREHTKAMQEGLVEVGKVGIAKRIGKDEYAGLPQHVRAAQWSNTNLGTNFKTGDKPVVLFARAPGLPRTDVVAIGWGEGLPDGVVMDWERTIERVIISPLREILDMLDIHPRTILADTVDAEEFW